MPQNGVGGVANGKYCVSMPLSQNRLIMLTPVTFLVLTLSINVLLMLLTSWLVALYALSMLCIMVNHTYKALQQLSARLSWSIV